MPGQIFQLLAINLPVLVEMQICAFFNPDMAWQEQLRPAIGCEEVAKLERKLKSLNVTGDKYFSDQSKHHNDENELVKHFYTFEDWHHGSLLLMLLQVASSKLINL